MKPANARTSAEIGRNIVAFEITLYPYLYVTQDFRVSYMYNTERYPLTPTSFLASFR